MVSWLYTKITTYWYSPRGIRTYLQVLRFHANWLRSLVTWRTGLSIKRSSGNLINRSQTWSLALERLIFSQFMGNNQQEKETMPNSAILMKTEEKNWTLDRTLFDRTLFDRTIFLSVSWKWVFLVFQPFIKNPFDCSHPCTQLQYD